VSYSFRLPQKESRLLLVLAAVYFITRLPLLNYLPLVKDEAIYAMMIREQAAHPTIIPTFLGYAVSWKPAPFFWVYSAFSGLPLPFELLFRLPSFIFGLLTIPILYRLLSNCGASRNIAFFSTLIFLLSMASIYPDAALLTDSLNFLLVSGSLLLYTEKKLGRKRFVAAAALAFAAFFAKLVIALMIPVLAVAYFLFNERKTLMDPVFLLSLLAVPAAFLVHYSILDSAGLARELFLSDIGGHIFNPEGFQEQVNAFAGSVGMFILGSGLWFALSLFGLRDHWKSNPFMSFWYLLTVFPLLSGNFMIWYYLPVMPAIAYFASMILIKWDGKDKLDAFFAFFFCSAAIISLGLVALVYVTLYDTYAPEREAGLFLAGKADAAIIGMYSPGIIAYKTLSEDRNGSVLDVGWVTGSREISGEEIGEYISDYHSDRYPVTDGSFSAFFTVKRNYRKDTNITSFRYIAISGLYDGTAPGGTLVYNHTNPDIRIYEAG
jgi:hypothetical protein